MSRGPVERGSWGEYEHVARCDDGCGWEGDDRDEAIEHTAATGHVTYYRRVFEETFRRRTQGGDDGSDP